MKKTVQLSRLVFGLAVLAAELFKVGEKEEKMRLAARVDVVMVGGEGNVGGLPTYHSGYLCDE